MARDPRQAFDGVAGYQLSLAFSNNLSSLLQDHSSRDALQISAYLN